MENIYNNNNVYILGAGFSAARGLPLIKNFSFVMREAADWLEQNNRKDEVESMATVFKFRQEAAAASYRTKIDVDNIEELFSLAAADGDEKLNKAMINSIAATINYCQIKKKQNQIRVKTDKEFEKEFKKELKNEQDFGNFFDDKIGINAYDFYVGFFTGKFSNDAGKNTFISFNYDTVLEESLKSLKEKFNYGMTRIHIENPDFCEKDQGIQILKLHGSINWGPPGTRGRKLIIYDSYEKANKNKKGQVLLPPTWQKNFDGTLHEVWQNSVKAIKEATRIIIIGFSIPETDIHFKYLLSSGLKDNISLRSIHFVNPMSSEDYNAKIGNIFQSSFVDLGYVTHVPMSLERTFRDTQFAQTINRPNDRLSSISH